VSNHDHVPVCRTDPLSLRGRLVPVRQGLILRTRKLSTKMEGDG